MSCLDGLLHASAAKRPDAPAVVDGERSISYGDLDTLAGRLATVLGELGVRRGDRVALYLDKSLEAIAGIYGVMRAGAAYIPLDPQAPPARLGYVAADADVRVLVTGAEKAGLWQQLIDNGAPFESLVVLNADEGFEAPAGTSVLTASDVAAADPLATGPAGADDLAYILYTSGSTGVPKGVMLSHRNCLGFVEWAVEEFAVTAADRLSSHAPLHFDLSTFDLFGASLAGAEVAIVPPEASIFPTGLHRFIADNEITVWYSVPSVLSMLDGAGRPLPAATCRGFGCSSSPARSSPPSICAG